MSASQNGAFLRIKGKELVKLLGSISEDVGEREAFFSVIKDDMVVDLHNYAGQDYIVNPDWLSETSDFKEVQNKILEFIKAIKIKSFQMITKKDLEKAVAEIKEIDWRYFDSCFEPWDLDTSEGGEDEAIGGSYTYTRYVYDSKTQKIGFNMETEYLSEGEFVEISDFLNDDMDIKTFLEHYEKNVKLQEKTKNKDVVKETVDMGDGKQVRVILRKQPEDEIYLAELKERIDGEDWYFYLTLYYETIWMANSESLIELEYRAHCDDDWGEFDSVVKNMKEMFNIELSECGIIQDHIKPKRIQNEYRDDLYQIVKDALLKVAKENGIRSRKLKN